MDEGPNPIGALEKHIPKGPEVQGAPKMEFPKVTERLQKLATSHSQQHGETMGGMDDFFHKPKPGDEQREDYERNT